MERLHVLVGRLDVFNLWHSRLHSLGEPHSFTLQALRFLNTGAAPALNSPATCLQVLATQKNGRWTTYAWLDGYTSIAGAEISPAAHDVHLEPSASVELWQHLLNTGSCVVADYKLCCPGTDLFFLPGVIMVLIQTGNSNLSYRIDRWERRGRKGPKPKYRWFLPFNVSFCVS